MIYYEEGFLLDHVVLTCAAFASVLCLFLVLRDSKSLAAERPGALRVLLASCSVLVLELNNAYLRRSPSLVSVLFARPAFLALTALYAKILASLKLPLVLLVPVRLSIEIALYFQYLESAIAILGFAFGYLVGYLVLAAYLVLHARRQSPPEVLVTFNPKANAKLDIEMSQ